MTFTNADRSFLLCVRSSYYCRSAKLNEEKECKMADGLTPVRVRGKTSKTSAQAAQLKLDRSRESRRRHVLELAREGPAKRTAIKQKQQRHLTPLEALPVELLDKIFFYSLNTNLPRASPSIAAAMSSERVYRILILWAFWDGPEDLQLNDGAHTAGAIPISRIQRLMGNEYRPLSREERRCLQSVILRCRWCTPERIRSQLPDLERLVIWRTWSGNANVRMTVDEQRDFEEYFSTELSKSQEAAKAAGGSRRRTFTATRKPRFSAPSCDDVDDDMFSWEKGVTRALSIVPSRLVSIEISNEGIGETDGMLWPVLNVLVFPSSLLRGYFDQGEEEPFSQRTMAYIETLCVHGCLINRETLGIAEHLSTSRSALQDGINNAIQHHKPRALAILLRLDEWIVRGQNGVGYSIPAVHFRTAVRTSPWKETEDGGRVRSSTMFRILLRASPESVPFDDPEVTQFAMDVGSAFRTWLLDVMVSGMSDDYSGMFNMGRPTSGRGRNFVEIDHDMARREDDDHFTVDDVDVLQDIHATAE